MEHNVLILRTILVSLAIIYGGQATANEVIQLQDIENSVLEKSNDIKSKKFEVEAAIEKRQALPSSYMPKLTLDANYKYLSVVPEIDMGPGKTLNFGDNKNYSIGPTLTLTLFDGNAKSSQQYALDKNLSSKKHGESNLRSSTLFKARFHYLNLVLLVDKRDLLLESLEVAKNQLKDVSVKKRLGAGSRLDLLTAKKEVHELESQYMEVDYNITAEKTELLKISHFEKIGRHLNRFETFELLIKKFEHYEEQHLDEKSNSKVKSIKDLAESLDGQARAINNSKLPRLSLVARSSYDYPNGPKLEHFNQNTIGLQLSMPLFDGGEINHLSAEKRMESQALKMRGIEEERNISESFVLIGKRIKNLKEQNKIIKQKIKETREIASLVFRSYQEGRSTFLDVERVNVKNREAKLSLSLNQHQIIFNLIQLAALAGE